MASERGRIGESLKDTVRPTKRISGAVNLEAKWARAREQEALDRLRRKFGNMANEGK